MAIDNVKNIVNTAFDLLGLDNVASIFTINNNAVKQMRAFLTQIAWDLKKISMPLGGFKQLIYDFEIVTVADQAEYDLPSNFDRFIGDTGWDKTNYYQLNSVSSEKWALYKNSVWGQNTIYKRFRLVKDNKIAFDPVPTQAGDILKFQYIGNQLFSNVDQSIFYEKPIADNNLFLLDDEIMIRALVYKYKLKAGIVAQDDVEDYENLIHNFKCDNNTATSMNIFANHENDIRNVFSRLVGQ